MPSATVQAPHALDALSEQPQVRDFFANTLAEGRLTHAYLFVGAPGTATKTAARALAKCIVCPAAGDASCGECIRVDHGTHPDVHELAPGSVVGYLAEQVRELIGDVQLSPIRAKAKVYILERADLLRGTAANALLKTLEEPPEGVVFILMAPSADAVMPTLVSRCQEVPFRPLATARAIEIVTQATGSDPARAQYALATAQTPEEAIQLLDSADRLALRHQMLSTLSELAYDDTWDVLVAARDLVAAAKAPTAALKEQQEASAKEQADYLSKGALKQLEAAHKRALSARERAGLTEALSAAQSLLRDVLSRLEAPEVPIVNIDFAEAIERMSATATTGGVLCALEAIDEASHNLARNVTAQLSFEVMLLTIKEALSCPPSSR